MNTTRIEPSSFRFSIWLDRTIPLVSKISEDRISLRDRETLSLSLSLSFPLSNILSISTRRERDRGKDARFLISEASIDRSLYPLSLRLPFPRYYFVAVSDPFTKQSR